MCRCMLAQCVGVLAQSGAKQHVTLCSIFWLETHQHSQVRHMQLQHQVCKQAVQGVIMSCALNQSHVQ